jgi:hypothetical protein
VSFDSIVRSAFIFAIIVIRTTEAGAWPHRHGQKARVRFLATSALIRGTWGPNEDSYLVDLRSTRNDEALLARLVGSYPNEAPLLSRKILTSVPGTKLLVNRDTECDRPFGEMLLRTPPAIQGESCGKDSAIGRSLSGHRDPTNQCLVTERCGDDVRSRHVAVEDREGMPRALLRESKDDLG